MLAEFGGGEAGNAAGESAGVAAGGDGGCVGVGALRNGGGRVGEGDGGGAGVGGHGMVVGVVLSVVHSRSIARSRFRRLVECWSFAIRFMEA